MNVSVLGLAPGGLALYAAFVLWLHGWLIDVPLIGRT